MVFHKFWSGGIGKTMNNDDVTLHKIRVTFDWFYLIFLGILLCRTFRDQIDINRVILVLVFIVLHTIITLVQEILEPAVDLYFMTFSIVAMFLTNIFFNLCVSLNCRLLITVFLSIINTFYGILSLKQNYTIT